MRQVRWLCVCVIVMAVLPAVAGAQQQQQQQQQQPQQRQQPGQPPATGAAPKAADPKAAAPKPSTTKFVTARDGTKIAYEVTGTGPAIMLLHGAGQNRTEWNRTDYVKRLAPSFTVIAVDLRGNGESDKPTTPEAYALDRFADDLLAVADAAGAQRFHVWGFAYGGIIGRSLAASSDRVRSLAYIGVPMGPAASGIYKDAIAGFIARWKPIIAEQEAGTPVRSKLSPGDYEALTKGGVKLAVAWQSALLEYPPMEPAQFTVPTLWLVATGDTEAMASVKAYEGKLADTKVSLATIDGPSHSETLQRIDLTFDKLVEFTKRAEAGS